MLAGNVDSIAIISNSVINNPFESIICIKLIYIHMLFFSEFPGFNQVTQQKTLTII